MNYNGVLSPTLFFEGRYRKARILSGLGKLALSGHHQRHDGARPHQGGTKRYWTSTFCGVCRDENRDNNDVFLKGNLLLVAEGGGRTPSCSGTTRSTTASGSRTTTSRAAAIASSGRRRWFAVQTVYPQFLTTGANRTLLPLPSHCRGGSQGTSFRTHSFFANDNLALEQQRDGQPRPSLGQKSRRRWPRQPPGARQRVQSARRCDRDPKGNGAVGRDRELREVRRRHRQLDRGLHRRSAGSPSSYQWAYNGPAINPDSNAATLVDTASAIQTVSTPRGRATRTASARRDGADHRRCRCLASVGEDSERPRVAPRERILGWRQPAARQPCRDSRGHTFRNYRDFYSTRIDTTTGRAVDSLGNSTDIGPHEGENTNDLKRRYQGLQLSVSYRVSGRTDIGGNSHCHGCGATSTAKTRRAVQCARRSSNIQSCASNRGTRQREISRRISVIGRVCGSTTACRRSRS